MSGYNHYAHFGGSHSQHVDVFGAYQELIETSGIPAMSHAPMPSSTPDPPRSLQPNGNYNFSYPSIASTIPTNPGQSPFKASGPTAPLAPLKKAPNGVMMNSPHIIPPNIQPHGSDFMPQKQPTLGHQYGPAPLGVGSGKDSVTTGVPFLHSSTPNMMIEQYYPYPSSLNGKRLLEAPSIQDSRPQKRIKLENQPLPPPESFPPILDDGIKPSHSYAMLIGMAILRSPHRRLTLAQIYKWITTNYRHYREAADNGWQNSIRHNLSLNKNFIKHERPKDDPGKGSYWAIMPGMEHVYMKEKPGRKSISTPEGMTIIGAVMENSILPQTSNPEPKLPPQTCSELSSEDATAATASQPCSAQQPELSSDATIPPQEEPLAKITEAESSTDLNSFSPNAEDMRSSPPLPKHAEIHGETPPSMMRRNSTTLKSHRRQRASMDDSGYISSLDSSILRPQQQTLLASETDRLDRSRNKRKGGRAEDEIRRLRGSSFDPSPTKCRSRNTTFGSQSSSPTRRFAGEGQMLPPLTPAYKLAPPPSIAPLSVSPNTTLQQHRRDVARMIESPLKRVMGLAGDCGWATPSNDHIDESVYNDSYNFNSGYGGDFYILQDATPGGLYSIAEDGSPVKRKRSIIDSSPLKRPTKRQGLPRPKSTAILGDVTHSNQQLSLAPAPLLKSKLSPAKYLALKSPGKKLPDLPSSPSKIFAGSPLKMGPSLGTLDTVNDENAVPSVLFQDFCSTELLEDGSESTDVDIMKGFERIGQNVGADPGNMPFAVANFKPGLGRNHTSTY